MPIYSCNVSIENSIPVVDRCSAECLHQQQTNTSFRYRCEPVSSPHIPPPFPLPSTALSTLRRKCFNITRKSTNHHFLSSDSKSPDQWPWISTFILQGEAALIALPSMKEAKIWSFFARKMAFSNDDHLEQNTPKDGSQISGSISWWA